jgi:hypothetical protein
MMVASLSKTAFGFNEILDSLESEYIMTDQGSNFIEQSQKE